MGDARVAAPAEIRDEDGFISGSAKKLALGARGVVYGDIGTSPLYALKQCFNGPNNVAASTDNVLGVLSLIVWSLILVVSIKYLLFVLRADNKGEGGIIALVALLNPWRATSGSRRHVLMLMGLFGAALLYGDGTVTPAISVLSAVEGLKIATSAFDPWIVPITVAILMMLFAVQPRGTASIAALFGPIMLVWFIVLGLLGLINLVQYPEVLAALHPAYGLAFLFESGMTGVVVLGTVFLAVTGAETLYADMGHFGRFPIRLAWFVVALPALLLNYFGQGALVLREPIEVEHPFYHLAPEWALYPLVALATIATIIASQAMISGTFSLTRQAIQFGQLPRLTVVQTNSEHIGQIFIPVVNWTLMAATIGLVLGFRSSSALGAAYGIAVSADMVITTILAFFVALRWGWSPVFSGILALMFLMVDVTFFGANLLKIAEGGWYPIFIALAVFSIMSIWRSGQARLLRLREGQRETSEEFLNRLAAHPPLRVRGTAVFLTSSTVDIPNLMLTQLEHNQVLHERVILLTIVTEDRPRVPTAERLEIEALDLGFHRIVAHYGFMQSPNVPVALRLCEILGLRVNPDDVTFYLGRENVVPARDAGIISLWRTRLFGLLSRNTLRATAFYNLPPGRVIEMGELIEI